MLLLLLLLDGFVTAAATSAALIAATGGGCSRCSVSVPPCAARARSLLQHWEGCQPGRQPHRSNAVVPCCTVAHIHARCPCTTGWWVPHKASHCHTLREGGGGCCLRVAMVMGRCLLSGTHDPCRSCRPALPGVRTAAAAASLVMRAHAPHQRRQLGCLHIVPSTHHRVCSCGNTERVIYMCTSGAPLHATTSYGGLACVMHPSTVSASARLIPCAPAEFDELKASRDALSRLHSTSIDKSAVGSRACERSASINTELVPPA